MEDGLVKPYYVSQSYIIGKDGKVCYRSFITTEDYSRTNNKYFSMNFNWTFWGYKSYNFSSGRYSVWKMK